MEKTETGFGAPSRFLPEGAHGRRALARPGKGTRDHGNRLSVKGSPLIVDNFVDNLWITWHCFSPLFWCIFATIKSCGEEATSRERGPPQPGGPLFVKGGEKGLEQKLKPMQERFCVEYVGDPKRNATQAAIRAGYSEKAARVQASENLTKLNILQRIKELEREALEEAGYSADSLRPLIMRQMSPKMMWSDCLSPSE